MGDFVRLWEAICHDFGDMLSYAPPSPTPLEETLLSSPLFVSVSSYRIYVESIYAYAYMDIWIYDVSALWEENNTIQCILAIFYSV